MLPNLGGQTGLNLSMELARQRLFGPQRRAACWAANPDTIDRAEDRQLFKDTMEKHRTSPAFPPRWWRTWIPRVAFAEEIGYPVIVRPAFTLGGTRRRYLRKR